MIWTPPEGIGLIRSPIVRTVRLRDGRWAKVTVDDSRTVQSTETDDGIDCVVRPRSVTIQLAKER